MKAVALLAFVVLSACRTSESIDSDPGKRTGAPAQSAAPHVEGIGDKAHGIELAPAPPGDVAMIVRTAREQARAKHRTLLVYIGATWCEPCKRFHRAVERGELDDQFPSLSLLVFDLDQDGDRLKIASYAPGYVPYFGLPGDDGKATSRATEGSVKGEGAVDNITPRLVRLLASANEN